MILDSNNYTVKILKQFDGESNYFNCTSYNNNILYRKETIYNKEFLISGIVNEEDNYILKPYTDKNLLYSFEDPRYINEKEISLNRVEIDINKNYNINIVKVCKFDLYTKEFTFYNTQSGIYEKNWQFLNNEILYNLQPYIIFDQQEIVIKEEYYDWGFWIDKYGYPFLSTREFNIGSNTYIIFHSHNRDSNGINFYYYCGLAQIDNNYNILGYYKLPLFDTSNLIETDISRGYFDWRRGLKNKCQVVNVVFPMTVQDNEKNIKIYCGINDCAAGIITIEKDILQKQLQYHSNIFEKF